MLLAALALIQAAPAEADALAASFAGWHVEIEDDLGPDSRVQRVSTADCVTTIVGEKGSWRVDWRTVETIAIEDTFVFLAGPQLKLAVVADVRDQAGRARLIGMRDAMTALGSRCQPNRR